MATLKNTKTVNPNARVNLSLKRLTRIQLEQYRMYADKAHEVEVAYTTSEIADMLLTAWFDQDAEFRKFRDGLTPAAQAQHLADAKKAEGAADQKARQD